MMRLLLLLVVLAAGITGATAQEYPSRSVRLIVPFGPGAGADISARLFADRLTARWGKPVVIENRPGGDGLVAIGAFLGANDDHTLLWAPAGTFAVHPYEHEKLPYDAERDLLPVAGVSSIILAASVPASLKVASMAELVALARAEPGKLNAAAANGNSDFLLFGFLKGAGLQLAKVPYRDILQAPNDLAEGRIQLLMTSLAVVQPLMQAGRLRILAVTSGKRAPSAPDAPTAAEAGFPALELESPVGVFGPRGMPLERRERIAEALRAVTDPIISSRIEATGQIFGIDGPAELAAKITRLRTSLAATAKILGISIKSAQ
jgi:tripartite-type tricarboxylate transporter receptor subunit TctC